MSGRALAVRNRLLVAAGAVLLAWLFEWTSDAGLLMLLVAVVATVLALMRGWFGGLPVLLHWLLRYRKVDIGLRELGDIIGEHDDDMHRAGLVVRQAPRRPPVWTYWRRRRPMLPRPRPDLLPRMRHRPYDGGIVVSLEAVRAGMSQEEILAAAPRLRSAWGVDVVRGEAKPGGRVVEFTIPFGEETHADDDGVPRPELYEPASPELDDAARHAPRGPVARPPDAPTVAVVQGRRGTGTTAQRPSSSATRPPTIHPQLQPDERGRYELTVLPADAARTFEPRPPEEPSDREGTARNPTTAEIPVIEAPTSLPARTPARAPSSKPLLNGGATTNPTDVDERQLRLGAQWRTGRSR